MSMRTVVNVIELEKWFLEDLSEKVGSDSQEYAMGAMLWRHVLGNGNAYYMLSNHHSMDRYAKEAIQSSEFEFEVKKHREDINTSAIISALEKAGLINPSVTFYRDIDSDEASEIILKDNLHEFEQETYDELTSELKKSTDLMKALCEEYGYDYKRLSDRRLSTHSPFHQVSPFTDKEKDKLAECSFKYEAGKGSVVDPETGREGYDPFLHVALGYRGVGKLGYFDERYMEVHEREIKDALWELTKDDPVLMEKAKAKARKTKIEELK